MFNPTRRNKNIGTSKQGYGQNNEMKIPYPAIEMKSFHERLTTYKKDYRVINGNRFEFIIEDTREDSSHACTINDVAEILRHILPKDYGRLNLIIFRQPKRKEEIISPVWGRLIYSYEFEDDYRPAIIIESQIIDKVLKWKKGLDIEDQKELKRLEKDGHKIVTDKRYHNIHLSLYSIRNTQLYRTLLHEIGHYNHYLELVGELEDIDDDLSYDVYEKNSDNYFSLNTQIKEQYAHNFANVIYNDLLTAKIIPFARIAEQE